MTLPPNGDFDAAKPDFVPEHLRAPPATDLPMEIEDHPFDLQDELDKEEAFRPDQQELFHRIDVGDGCPPDKIEPGNHLDFTPSPQIDDYQIQDHPFDMEDAVTPANSPIRPEEEELCERMAAGDYDERNFWDEDQPVGDALDALSSPDSAHLAAQVGGGVGQSSSDEPETMEDIAPGEQPAEEPAEQSDGGDDITSHEVASQQPENPPIPVPQLQYPLTQVPSDDEATESSSQGNPRDSGSDLEELGDDYSASSFACKF